MRLRACPLAPFVDIEDIGEPNVMSAVQRLDLRLEGVTKVYPGAVALNDVRLPIKAGEGVGLHGEKGAGK